MRRGLPGTAAALLALWAVACCCKSEALRHSDVGPPGSFAIPFEGPGQLASIWSWGIVRPWSGRWALVVARRGRIQRLPFESPDRVRWRSPRELIVENTIPPQRSGGGRRMLRITPDGEILEVLSDRGLLTFAEPSPDGRWLALSRHDREGQRTVEIRDLEGGFAPTRVHHAPGDPLARYFATRKIWIWSPDGSQLAVAVRGWISREKPGHFTERTVLVARDRPGFELLPDRVPGEDRGETGGLRPLFWTERGIYGKHQRDAGRLLRCDPGGGGCRLVYEAGPHRVFLEGRTAGDDVALLLVVDFRVDPFEGRSVEIHQLDLATGEGGVLLRLPEGVFISDIDWSPDPAGE